jgi:ATP-dependent helicase/nuclease subunit B
MNYLLEIFSLFSKILTFEKAMNEAENVRGFATAFYETMEAFDLPKYLMTHRDQLDVESNTVTKSSKI